MRNEALAESNALGLRKVCPQYADMLTAVPDTDRYVFEPIGNSVGCREKSGRWLHGPDDPWETAKRDVAALVEESDQIYIVLRPGLGYNALALLDALESRGTGSVVLVVEDRVDLWKAALGYTNWGPVFRCSSAVLLLGDPERVIDAFFAAHPKLSLLPVTLVATSEATEDLDCSRIAEQLKTRSNAVRTAVEDELSTADVLLAQWRNRSLPLRVLLAGEHGYLAGPFADGLRACGCSVEALPWTPNGLPRNVRANEWPFELLRLSPDIIFWMNRPEVSRFGSEALRGLGVANVVWSLDSPRRAHLTRSELETVDLHLYFDTQDLATYGPLGARRSEQMSLAAGIEPLPECRPSTTAWPRRQGPEVSFVGSLGVGRMTALRDFIQRVRPEDLAFLDEISHEADPGAIFERETGKRYAGPPVLYIDEVRTARRRLDVLTRLPRHSLRVFGGADWKERSSPLGDCFYGSVKYGPELASVYYHSLVNINVFHAQCVDSTNSRIYDVLASGGFLLTEDRPVLHREFEVGRHLVTFSGPEEANDKVAFYLAHPAEREAIAREGQRYVLSHHTFRERFRQFIALARPFVARTDNGTSVHGGET